MISQFPNFKKLEFSDREEIQSFTKNFPPYSDFNFTSIWSWNTEEKIKISYLNKNLVIEFTHYLTSEPFLSFLGENDVDNTSETLIEFAKDKKIDHHLRLIPEETIKSINKEKFKILADEDNFDYVLSTKTLASYPGKKLYSKRKHLNQFINNYQYNVNIFSIDDQLLKKEVINCLSNWKDSKTQNEKSFNTIEIKAINRLLNAPNKLENHFALTVHINKTLEAFYIMEIINKKWAIGHFEKENHNFKGISAFLKNQVGKNLLKKGVEFLNIEQDLGVEGLRESKRRYLPDHYLKQYIIEAN